MELITQTYEIPSYRLDGVQHVIDTLNKRCRRLHIPEITIKITGSRTEEYEKNLQKLTRVFNTVEVTGAQPKLDGWEFAATFEHDAETGLTIIRNNAAFTTPIPAEFRKASPVCDHCKLARRRNDTFLCYNAQDKQFKQIGRNCLRDFLGHKDPHAVLAAAEIWFDLTECLGDEDGDPDDGWREYGYKTVVVLNRDEFVTRAFAVTRTKGFIGRGKAKENPEAGLYPTADCLLDLLLPSKSQREDRKWVKLNEETQSNERDHEDALAAIEWVKGFEARLDSLNDYQHNLFVACASEVLPVRRVGIVASLAAAYLKHVERVKAEKQAQESRLNEYFGTVGERLRGLVLKVENIFANENQFGVTYITRFSDKEGRTFVWFASGTELEKDKSYKVTGTVKAHTEYQKKGSTFEPLKQTILSRCDCNEVVPGYEDAEQYGNYVVIAQGEKFAALHVYDKKFVEFDKRKDAVKFAKGASKDFYGGITLAAQKRGLAVLTLPDPENASGEAQEALAVAI